MYTPRHFKVDDPNVLFELMRRYSFATLVTVEEGVPVATHLPVIVRREPEGDRLLGHVARANPQWKGLSTTREVLVIFEGPHAYVSPSWYAKAPNVPTWNYAVVHAYGSARLIEEPAAVVDVLRELTNLHESRFEQPWRMESAEAYVKGLQGGIVAFELSITRLEGKLKLSQNKSSEDRAGVIAALRRSEDALDRELAELMARHASP
ncbi:FMN-binding negative transcriptional regulator [Hyalangium rubrum]|uniref:FMN-binding negative transcriptional regulator n=1 Tax=Hyalangium rubrum TaxID=3103134 RepID=A0ABU5H8H1_9BACT|nr:FMN-binding negative transcriptional regulator [Hyalangium sp. s54d21]MDY7229772.1 FMN-binding negative transcriptional regulator [Hyalangium sp. s54d21]